MKKSLLYVSCLFVLSMMVIPCSAYAFFAVDASVGYWQQSPSGTLAYNPGVTTPQTIDLKKDLNLDDASKPMARIRMELPLILPNIYLMYTPMSFEGSGRMSQNITYGGQSFNLTSDVVSSLKFDHYDVALFYSVPFLKTATTGILNVDFGLNAKIISFEGTLTQAGITKTASQSIPLPTIFLAAQIKPISLFSIEAEMRYIGYGDSSLSDYIARARINPLPLVFVGLGYRSEALKVEESGIDVKADVKFSGPFAEVGVSF